MSVGSSMSVLDSAMASNKSSSTTDMEIPAPHMPEFHTLVTRASSPLRPPSESANTSQLSSFASRTRPTSVFEAI